MYFGCHYYPRVGVSKRGYSSRPVCVCVCECVCVCVCAQLFCSGCCYFLSAYSRDSRPSQPVAKSCLLSIDVFFLLLKIGKSPWCAKKYVLKCHAPIVQALGNLKALNDRASQDL